ncbi:MAG TPA: hypothetical protein DIS68_01230, partial [Lachnospiraceae bacterium]|nr:hypothetical protein [Lachnospiraceae bacterium]
MTDEVKITNVLDMLDDTAARYPRRVAFADPYRKITFGKLKRSTEVIGSFLMSEESGVRLQPGEAVAFYMEKSVRAVEAMLGAVRAGGFYSFIDVRQPAERAAGVISVLEPAVIVTDGDNSESLRAALMILGERYEVYD